MGLTFSVEDEVFGRRQAHELCPGGDDMAVTSANKLLYVHLVADWHLNRRLGKPAASFAAGVNQVGSIWTHSVSSWTFLLCGVVVHRRLWSERMHVAMLQPPACAPADPDRHVHILCEGWHSVCNEKVKGTPRATPFISSILICAGDFECMAEAVQSKGGQ